MRQPSRARDRREDLILRSLAVVDDAIRRCRADGHLLGEELGLRLALAFLYAVARRRAEIDEPPRRAFDELWNAVTGRTEMDDRRGFRSTWATTQLSIIERRVGQVGWRDDGYPLRPADLGDRRRYDAVIRRPTADPPPG